MNQSLRLFFTFFLFSLLGNLTAQTRSNLDATLAPFFHGVASGDPTADAVIIWTRVTPDAAQPTISVEWRVSTTADMQNVVKFGTITTDATKDYTVKVDVTGLNANTFYYYEFTALGKNSLTGRTKTFPTGAGVQNLRFAIVSCSSYPHGYFNAYSAIHTNVNDIDAILHLGDYLYEYGNGQYGSAFELQPPTEYIFQADYNTRHSYYKLEPELRKLHQQFPFITTWDDHEFTDNAYTIGANNHTEGENYAAGQEGFWGNRKRFAKTAYFNWMPIRLNSPGGDSSIYRSFKIGDLAEVFSVDTRVEDRDEQYEAGGSNTTFATQPDHDLIGAAQLTWLNNGMKNSTSRWKIMAQQIMFAPLADNTRNVAVNLDQWDGYARERDRVMNNLKTNNVKNFVVLTGDIHSSWANDIPNNDITAPYAPTGTTQPCTNSIGVEFVTPSVTSPAFDFLGPGAPGAAAGIMANNPHEKFVDLSNKGYTILDITPTRTQSEWYFSAPIATQASTQTFARAYFVNNNETCLRQAMTPSVGTADKIATKAPAQPRAALPIQLASFSGWNEGTRNRLEWYTASEINNEKFEIEKSKDGKSFQKIGEVKGKINSQITQKYEYLDNQTANGVTYYRLKQIDVNGTYSYSPVIAVELMDKKFYSFYPNPAVEMTNISFNNQIAEPITVQVIDGTGKIVKSMNLNATEGYNKFPLDLQDIQGGIYVIRVLHETSGREGRDILLKMNYR